MAKTERQLQTTSVSYNWVLGQPGRGGLPMSEKTRPSSRLQLLKDMKTEEPKQLQ